jgi:bifunctional non-homologous end joining protein LigD
MARAVATTSAVRAPRGRPADRPLVGGVGISHPDRVVFPDIGATKLDLARYYEAIASWIVPHLADRPLTLVRCPEGARGSGPHEAGCFYMKHSKVWAPVPIRRVRIREKTKIGEYLIADSLDALVGLVQMGVLEVHTWNSRFARIEQPDRIVIDIDPGGSVPWPAVVDAARVVRQLLSILELDSFVKTTGGRGLHVVVPLTPKADWSECLDFARAVAETLERRDPARYTTRFAKAGRDTKMLIDYLRNNRTNTSVAAYSTRARPNAPVSVPIAWSELSESRPPGRFTIRTVPSRLARLNRDPWREYWTTRQTIPRGAVAALNRL